MLPILNHPNTNGFTVWDRYIFNWQEQKMSELVSTTVLEIGELAPNFTTDTADGKSIQLSDYRGKGDFIFLSS